MKRVKSWAHYKENWADWWSFAWLVTLEMLVALVLVFIMLPFTALATLLGYCPDMEKDEND
ncbi:MAG: hypothetical protein V3T88_00165 [Nitrosomonadaceae bacterium]